MKPGSEHTRRVEGYTSSDFAAWLRRGFEDLNHEERRRTAFAPLNYFVGYQDDLTRELKNIYDLLSGTAKESFRKGIATAFSNLPPEDSSVATAEELLHLAGRLQATEVLPEIVRCIGSGFFGLPNRDEGRRLFALGLDIAAGMAPAKGVADSVRALVGSSFFRSGYTPRALIALCRAEPECFPEHLDLLRDDFAKLHSEERGIESVHITASRFVHYVGLSAIADHLQRMLFVVKPGNKLTSDYWLGEALFVGDKAPLILDKSEDSFRISRRDRQEENDKTWFDIHLNWAQEERNSAEPLRMFLDHCIECDGGSWMWKDIDIEQLNEKLRTSAIQPHLAIASDGSLTPSTLFATIQPPLRISPQYGHNPLISGFPNQNLGKEAKWLSPLCSSSMIQKQMQSSSERMQA